MSFFQNTCKPKGLGGSLMVNMMNIGHSPMAEWGLKHIKINKNDISLDVGCGGGANIKKLLEKSPKGKVFGIDYSEVSVRKSKKVNKFAVERKHCEILQGNVQELPFANETFDLATAFETIYFWSDIDQSFSQIYRVLKKGGIFMVCNEWILCPVCVNKTRTMIQENTEMRNFPLYCPKCKKETIINVQDMKITLAVSK